MLQQIILCFTYQPGPPRSFLGRWDWKAAWADDVFEQHLRQRPSTAAQSSLNSTAATQEAWYASFDVEWLLGDEPLLNLGWMVFMGILGGCWSCLFNLSIPPPSLVKRKSFFRRKQKPKLWKMKRQIKSWEQATKKLVTVIYSCRIVKKRRLKRSKRQRQFLQKFVWWRPQKYRHCGSSVKIILGKQGQSWPKWTYPDSGSEIKKCEETNLHIQTAHMNRTELSGGAGGKAAGPNRIRDVNRQKARLNLVIVLGPKLIAVLKTCLNEGSSDSEVAETFFKTFTPNTTAGTSESCYMGRCLGRSGIMAGS